MKKVTSPIAPPPLAGTPGSSITQATSVPTSGLGGTEGKGQGAPAPKGKKTLKGRSRHTLLTWNNYTPDNVSWFKSYIERECDYGCFAEEVAPTTGTPHLQGYVHWENPRSLDSFHKATLRKTHLGDEHGRTDGSADDNRKYCLGLVEKKGNTPNPTFWEHGTLPKQGERTDWRTAVDSLKGGMGVCEVIDEQPQLLPCIRALERYNAIKSKSIHRDIRVVVVYGAPGTGKSRAAWDLYPDLYVKPDGDWWDGYEGQDVVLFDDFYGGVKISTMLKWLDRYPLLLPVKGGFVPARFTKVILTSNTHPSTWYSGEFIPEDVLNAFKRRIHAVLTPNQMLLEDITNALEVHEKEKDSDA